MQQLVLLWNALTPQRRLIVAAAAAAAFAAVLLLARMAASPGMALLYSGLDPGAAGAIVAALEQRNVAHEIRGTAIYVDSQQRDALRMTLAAEGLPANGAAGYEILDGLSGFGTTAQMFDAAYWRAKEGELARTIVSAPRIRSARVHIANPVSGPFRRDAVPTASVSVATAAGALTLGQAKAMRFLIASAVAGLSPAKVSVIDSERGLVGAEGDSAPGGAAAGSIGARLRASVERLLEARVGRGKAAVEVNVETVTDSETIVEKSFDPEGRVAISTESVETNTNEKDSGSLGVTVASNLPDGDAGRGQESSSRNSETQERVNYEVSETRRELVRAPGAIRRLSVAVLVDGVRGIDVAGRESWAPRDTAELASLEELVKSAVGFSADRGDVVTVRSMEFIRPDAAGTLVEAALMDRLGIDAMSIIQLGVLALVSLGLGLFVVRPVLTAAPGSVSAVVELAAPLPEGGVAAITSGEPAPETVRIEEDPVTRLRQLIEHRQEDTAEILRNWLEAPEERT